MVALASKNGFLYVFDRLTGKPLWPIEERPVPKIGSAGGVDVADAAVPDYAAAFARQSMTAKDLNFAFMTPEEKEHWQERFAKAQNKGLFTPTGLTDTISIPGVNGGPFFWDTEADAAKGWVFVESKDFPSILKMVKAGESTAQNSGGTIPSRVQPGGGGAGAADSL